MSISRKRSKYYGNSKSQAFLEANERKNGVIVLEHGLQYKILEEGKGRYLPDMIDLCEIILEERHIDGRKVLYTYQERDESEPMLIVPKGQMPGVKMALSQMAEGDHWEFYVPANLAYGLRGNRIDPKVTSGEALIYRIRMLRIGHRKNPKRPALRCRLNRQDQCDEKEHKYIAKIRDMSLENSDLQFKSYIESEMKRLQRISNGTIHNQNLEWIQRRSAILLQFRHKDITTSSADYNEKKGASQEHDSFDDDEEEIWGDIVDLDKDDEL